MNNFIILLFGESGSGKTTVAEKMETLFGWHSVQSYTDRAMRFPDEKGHVFVTDERFDMIPKDKMVAYTEFDGHRYCATVDQIEDNELYVIDPKGIKEFGKRYTGNKVCIPVYLCASEDLRRERMLKRGDKLEAVEKRIEHDKEAFKDAGVIAKIRIEVERRKSLANIVSEVFHAVSDYYLKPIEKPYRLFE